MSDVTMTAATYIAVDPQQLEALQIAAARYFRERFNAAKSFYDAFLIADAVKDAGLDELYNELSDDLKMIPR